VGDEGDLEAAAEEAPVPAAGTVELPAGTGTMGADGLGTGTMGVAVGATGVTGVELVHVILWCQGVQCRLTGRCAHGHGGDNSGNRRCGSRDAGRGSNNGRDNGGRRSLDLTVADLGDGLDARLGNGSDNGSEKGE
jgi:hypothetical protein